jgi:hypothetical protein
MGHRHLVEVTGERACRLTNTIYVEGPLSGIWRRLIGPRAAKALPDGQRKTVEIAEEG